MFGKRLTREQRDMWDRLVDPKRLEARQVLRKQSAQGLFWTIAGIIAILMV